MGPPLLFLGLEDQKHFFGPIPAAWIPSKQLKVSSEAGLKTRYLHWVPRMPGGPGGPEEGTGDGPGRPGGPRVPGALGKVREGAKKARRPRRGF